MTKMRSLVTILVLLTCTFHVLAARKLHGDEPVPVPVHYADQAVIVVTPAGTAAFRFTDAIEEGSRYEYRFRPADGGEETTGTGEVFQKYERRPTGTPGEWELIDRGSELRLLAGDISLKWSYFTKVAGWIYFAPEDERVHLIYAEDFGEVDLSRFTH